MNKKPVDEVIADHGRLVLVVASRPETQRALVALADEIERFSGQELTCIANGCVFSIFSRGNISMTQGVIDMLWAEIDSIVGVSGKQATH